MVIELISNGMTLFSCQITNPWILHLETLFAQSLEELLECWRMEVGGRGRGKLLYSSFLYPCLNMWSALAVKKREQEELLRSRHYTKQCPKNCPAYE